MPNPHPVCSMKPGETRNPNGRPKKGYSITEIFQDMFKHSSKKRKDIALAIYEKALEGDAVAMKLIWNYMDGMPVSKNEHYGKNGQPLTVEFKVQTPESKQALESLYESKTNDERSSSGDD